MRYSKNVTALDRAVFFQNLATMVNAGLPLAASLDSLAQQSENRTLAQTASQLSRDLVRKGWTLSLALMRHSRVFNAFHSHSIEIGERTGTLHQVFSILAAHEEERRRLALTLRQALAYPLTVSLLSFLALAFLPNIFFGDLVDDGVLQQGAGLYLVQLSRLLMTPSLWATLAGLTLVLAGVVRAPRHRGRAAAALTRLGKRLPFFSQLIATRNALSFVTSLEILNRVGAPLVESLGLALAATGDRDLMARRSEFLNGVVAGRGVAESLTFLPSIVRQMMAVGEESGKLDVMLNRAAELLRLDLNTRIEQALKSLEPLMLLFTGAVVGTLAISVLQAVSTMTA